MVDKQTPSKVAKKPATTKNKPQTVPKATSKHASVLGRLGGRPRG